MSDLLLALLLVTSSANGSNLVYRWPPFPELSSRLVRPLPHHDTTCAQGDNPWRAAIASDRPVEESKVCPDGLPRVEDESYLWKRPNIFRRRSLSGARSRSHPSSRTSSPSKDADESYVGGANTGSPVDDGYDSVLGYPAEFLAGMLCPQSSMCHQRFGFVVDDLVFLGHPVCAEPDGTWRFKPEKNKLAPRGRVSRKGETPQSVEKPLTPDRAEKHRRAPPDSKWLTTFHFVVVLDRPDPSSSSPASVWKYMDTIYERLVFAITAVLFQEQILHNYVETECDKLGSLKDDYTSKGMPFSEYMSEALNVSSLAPAMKTLYDSIKASSIARITIHDLPLELHLPPSLESMLRAEEDDNADMADREDENDLTSVWDDTWGSRGFMAVAPWKSLLLLDDEDEQGYELYMRLRGPQLMPEDRELAEQLMKFLDLASISLSLADMATLLDWDLESQVYPTVRWLVHHRRAKVVDFVHPGLKTVFSIPQKFSAPLSELSAEFDRVFASSGVPPLSKLVSVVSMASQQQSANHFFATVVKSKDLIPLYEDVVIWMLKRDLLITLHLRIRIVATEELKDRVRMKFEMARAKKERIQAQARNREHEKESSSQDTPRQGAEIKEFAPGTSPAMNWFSLSPHSARKHARQFTEDVQSQSSLQTQPDAVEKVQDDEFEDGFGSSGAEEEDWYRGDDNNPYSSMVSDPARASRLERLWLAAMSDGKDAYIVKRFEQINQYFDGKCTDDEILFRAEISRKQLREVLHHYDEYVQTFLHPS
ncbi:uncharacterized protein FIBRA_00797 [Fibroporia radiculosa]|uniref:Nitrogen permease regulator 3 n=1 Tax=Fibroporia radiculosa TaxID=599839 RepID=J4HS73_9APHY|nr:uncharacterized protein FIBRA_00797 [Fibroporia radiculosa]CCL98792.1 predicted protein [Fibroporia radiculosa]